MYKLIKKGLSRKVALPNYGGQSKGLNPGGAQDLFAYRSGNILLGNDAGEQALEFITAPQVEFIEKTYFVTTGAVYAEIRLNEKRLNHGQVYLAKAGDHLSFKKKMYGFRSYLCVRIGEGHEGLEGRKRGSFKEVAQWPSWDACIRVLKGPEWGNLNQPDSFLKNEWEVSREMSEMGVKLNGPQLNLKNQFQMISSPVNPGCIQLTPSGPIVLMRECQTVGGYPRIFSVITADLDLLAQIPPGKKVKFKLVDIEEARLILRQQEDDLGRLKKKFL